jgi:hypothetical protein
MPLRRKRLWENYAYDWHNGTQSESWDYRFNGRCFSFFWKNLHSLQPIGNIKHISAITYAATTGKSLVPHISTLQDFPSLREQVKKHGVRFGTDLVLKSNLKPYIDAKIFFNRLRTVFLSNLAQLPGLDEFAEGRALLLTDNCWGHIARI